MSIHQGCDDEPAVNKCSDDTVVKMDNDSNGINSSQDDTDHKVATTANSDSIEIVDNKTNGQNESNINGHDTHTEENDVKDDDIHQQDLNGHFIDDETGIEWGYEIAIIGTDLDERGNYKPLVDYSVDDETRKFKTYEEAELAWLKKLIKIVKNK